MALLPSGFEKLERFVGDWAVAGDLERLRRREAASRETLKTFYDVMKDEIDAAMDYLKQYSMTDLPDDAARLYQMALSFMDVGFLLERVMRTDRSVIYPLSRLELTPNRVFEKP